MITNGPKVERLFPLQFHSSNFYLYCIDVTHPFIDFHNKLGHPNFFVLSHLIKTCFLGNKNITIDLSFKFLVCKLSKRKTVPFLLHAYYGEKCFEITHNDVCGMSNINTF